jgi:exonuclease III
MLQETHYYQTTHYHVKGVENTAKRAGWTAYAYHAQATATDLRGGLAILVRAGSQTVTITEGSPPQRGLNGRLIGIECMIENERVYIYSLYMPAKPDKRLDTLLKIEQQGLIKKQLNSRSGL